MRSTITGENLHDMHACDYVSDELYNVNSCGSQVHDGNDAVVSRPEGRQDYHLLFIADGKCTAKVDGVDHSLARGDMLLYRPTEPQWYSFSKGRCSSFWLHLSGTGVEALCAQSGLMQGNVFHLSDLADIERTHMKLIVETQSKQKGYKLFVQSYIELHFAHICRKMSENGNEESTLVPDERILKVLNVLDRLYYMPLDVDRLAAECNVGRDRFLHLFTKSVGMPPQKYVTTIRIKNAKRMLSETDRSVAEIAERCGFNDSMYFSRVFKKKTALAPSEYRKVYGKR